MAMSGIVRKSTPTGKIFGVGSTGTKSWYEFGGNSYDSLAEAEYARAARQQSGADAAIRNAPKTALKTANTLLSGMGNSKSNADAHLAQANQYALQDRAQGIEWYKDDRNRFYEGQGQHNQWQEDAYSQNLDWINRDRARYAEVFQPMEERLAEIADPSEAQYQQAYSRANADTAQQFATQRDVLARQLARYGLNPNSGRAMSAMGGLATGEALAQTQARATAADSVRDRADSALQLGLNLGQNYRNTQTLDAPDIRYDVMGPRQANGLEAALPDIASSRAGLEQAYFDTTVKARSQAYQTEVENAWQQYKNVLTQQGMGNDVAIARMNANARIKSAIAPYPTALTTLGGDKFTGRDWAIAPNNQNANFNLPPMPRPSGGGR